MMPDPNNIQELILDSIIDDDANTFIQLVIGNSNQKCDINKKLTILSNKLINRPSYALVYCFFGAEECLSVLSQNISGGFNSIEMKKTDDKRRILMHFASASRNFHIVANLYKNYHYKIDEKDDDNLTPLH